MLRKKNNQQVSLLFSSDLLIKEVHISTFFLAAIWLFFIIRHERIQKSRLDMYISKTFSLLLSLLCFQKMRKVKFANYSNIKLTLSTYFSSRANAIESIELNQSSQPHNKPVQYCTVIRLIFLGPKPQYLRIRYF